MQKLIMEKDHGMFVNIVNRHLEEGWTVVVGTLAASFGNWSPQQHIFPIYMVVITK